MQNYLKSSGRFLKEFLIDDIANRYLFFGSLVLSFADYLVWHYILSSPTIFVYIKIGVYPVKLLFAILIINTFLAVTSYRKEREIAYLLFIGNFLIAGLIATLEIFYLFHR